MSEVGHVIPGGFFNPGISGLKIRNPGISPGIRQKLILSQHAWFEVYTLYFKIKNSVNLLISLYYQKCTFLLVFTFLVFINYYTRNYTIFTYLYSITNLYVTT